MDFDTNHPKLIIAAVACDRNGLTNEAAAFNVRLSAFISAHTAGDIRLRVKIKYFKHTVFILAAVDAYKPFYF